MKERISEMTLKMALFLFIFNLIMLFIVNFKSAEWYITVISMVLMLVLIIIARIRLKTVGDNE